MSAARRPHAAPAAQAEARRTEEKASALILPLLPPGFDCRAAVVVGAISAGSGGGDASQLALLSSQLEALFAHFLGRCASDLGAFDVKVVPGVMLRVDLYQSDERRTLEMRIHLFMRCASTYVHNHSYSFASLCVGGGYEERKFAVVDGGEGAQSHHYAHVRDKGNRLRPPQRRAGRLAEVPGSRRAHAPGNVLLLGSHEFHATSTALRGGVSGGSASCAAAAPLPGGGANACSPSVEAATFIVICRPEVPPESGTTILSDGPEVEAPHEEIRPATAEEVEVVRQWVAAAAAKGDKQLQGERMRSPTAAASAG